MVWLGVPLHEKNPGAGQSFSGMHRALSEGLKRSGGDFLSPFLHKVSGHRKFERWRTVAYLLPQVGHGRRTQHRILHTHRHECRPVPLRPEPLAGFARNFRAVGIGLVRHDLWESAHGNFVSRIWERCYTPGFPLIHDC